MLELVYKFHLKWNALLGIEGPSPSGATIKYQPVILTKNNVLKRTNKAL